MDIKEYIIIKYFNTKKINNKFKFVNASYLTSLCEILRAFQQKLLQKQKWCYQKNSLSMLSYYL